eukprot:scaffold607_cov160-Ochromonas_danica.AAC.35
MKKKGQMHQKHLDLLAACTTSGKVDSLQSEACRLYSVGLYELMIGTLTHADVHIHHALDH